MFIAMELFLLKMFLFKGTRKKIHIQILQRKYYYRFWHFWKGSDFLKQNILFIQCIQTYSTFYFVHINLEHLFFTKYTQQCKFNYAVAQWSAS